MIPQINVILEPKNISVTQGLPQIIVPLETPNISVVQGQPKINVELVVKQIVVVGTNNMLNIIPFSVTATSDGQTVFTIPYSYKTIICLFIMGTGQDPLAGDYTVSANVITLGATAPVMQVGDLMYGAGQI